MRKIFLFLFLSAVTWNCAIAEENKYVPSPSNLKARQAFEEMRFGIFIHWGIYSMFAQGEWYLNSGLSDEEYRKAASGFYPARFDANAWVKAIKSSGAQYITFTSRHHDGFSMYGTHTSKYNIVDGTPFRRDVLKELSQACAEQNVRLHLYYSILDWHRNDFPLGRTGRKTGREMHIDYDSYFDFMKTQVKELLTDYAPIEALWFDGYWDHDEDSIPFDWRMPEFYRYIHALQPSCLIGNNHHIAPIEGEDFQMFERDLPGENTAGLSGQAISQLPLEMCQTMNGMWGYKVADQNYKSTGELIQLIARAAAKSSNLLLNIGPQPNGELPATALDRLQGIGQWMQTNGESIYGTKGAGEYPWGVMTQKDKTSYVHIFDRNVTSIEIPWTGKHPRTIQSLATGEQLKARLDKRKHLLTIILPATHESDDWVVKITNDKNPRT
ncbi:MAG: alpha-L-fucosidase [Bacteroidales bacterium]|nr:alpha-L-fucosidase [Bacteroidales bacterium]